MEGKPFNKNIISSSNWLKKKKKGKSPIGFALNTIWGSSILHLDGHPNFYYQFSSFDFEISISKPFGIYGFRLLECAEISISFVKRNFLELNVLTHPILDPSFNVWTECTCGRFHNGWFQHCCPSQFWRGKLYCLYCSTMLVHKFIVLMNGQIQFRSQ